MNQNTFSWLVRSLFAWIIFSVSLPLISAQVAKPKIPNRKLPPIDAAARGKSLFARDCAFCHGRNAGGGESGPALTQSHLVTRDITGDKIRAVIHEGRLDKGMPPFPKLLPTQLNDLIAFIRNQVRAANAKPGGRAGVEVADLQTGNADAGKAYFNGAGKCSSCHSPTGDLAGIATRYVGLELEKRMLYPEDAKSNVTVTTSSGQTFSGVLAYKDEFHVSLTDADGWVRTWPVAQTQIKIDSPADGHVELFPKYTDADIHNLMAYLQTLR